MHKAISQLFLSITLLLSSVTTLAQSNESRPIGPVLEDGSFGDLSGVSVKQYETESLLPNFNKPKMIGPTLEEGGFYTSQEDIQRSQSKAFDLSKGGVAAEKLPTFTEEYSFGDSEREDQDYYYEEQAGVPIENGACDSNNQFNFSEITNQCDEFALTPFDMNNKENEGLPKAVSSLIGFMSGGASSVFTSSYEFLNGVTKIYKSKNASKAYCNDCVGKPFENLPDSQKNQMSLEEAKNKFKDVVFESQIQKKLKTIYDNHKFMEKFENGLRAYGLLDQVKDRAKKEFVELEKGRSGISTEEYENQLFCKQFGSESYQNKIIEECAGAQKVLKQYNEEALNNDKKLSSSCYQNVCTVGDKGVERKSPELLKYNDESEIDNQINTFFNQQISKNYDELAEMCDSGDKSKERAQEVLLKNNEDLDLKQNIVDIYGKGHPMWMVPVNDIDYLCLKLKDNKEEILDASSGGMANILKNDFENKDMAEAIYKSFKKISKRLCPNFRVLDGVKKLICEKKVNNSDIQDFLANSKGDDLINKMGFKSKEQLNAISSVMLCLSTAVDREKATPIDKNQDNTFAGSISEVEKGKVEKGIESLATDTFFEQEKLSSNILQTSTSSPSTSSENRGAVDKSSTAARIQKIKGEGVPLTNSRTPASEISTSTSMEKGASNSDTEANESASSSSLSGNENQSLATQKKKYDVEEVYRKFQEDQRNGTFETKRNFQEYNPTQRVLPPPAEVSDILENDSDLRNEFRDSAMAYNQKFPDAEASEKIMDYVSGRSKSLFPEDEEKKKDEDKDKLQKQIDELKEKLAKQSNENKKSEEKGKLSEELEKSNKRINELERYIAEFHTAQKTTNRNTANNSNAAASSNYKSHSSGRTSNGEVSGSNQSVESKGPVINRIPQSVANDLLNIVQSNKAEFQVNREKLVIKQGVNVYPIDLEDIVVLNGAVQTIVYKGKKIKVATLPKNSRVAIEAFVQKQSPKLLVQKLEKVIDRTPSSVEEPNPNLTRYLQLICTLNPENPKCSK